jgi:hypothetical protein
LFTDYCVFQGMLAAGLYNDATPPAGPDRGLWHVSADAAKKCLTDHQSDEI